MSPCFQSMVTNLVKCISLVCTKNIFFESAHSKAGLLEVNGNFVMNFKGAKMSPQELEYGFPCTMGQSNIYEQLYCYKSSMKVFFVLCCVFLYLFEQLWRGNTSWYNNTVLYGEKFTGNRHPIQGLWPTLK